MNYTSLTPKEDLKLEKNKTKWSEWWFIWIPADRGRLETNWGDLHLDPIELPHQIGKDIWLHN